MTQSTDIASTIGTWLAVSLALLALVGVVGPLLVWRASKSARNLAINALDQDTAETFGYVDRGIWAGPHARVFRRVRAPALKASAGWVQFGSLVAAHRVSFKQNDCLIIDSGHAWLPVRKTWILVFGLLGRYGGWLDKGKLALQVPRGTASTQARPGRLFDRRKHASRALAPGHRRMPGNTPGYETSRRLTVPLYEHAPTDSMIRDEKHYAPIYGLSGTYNFVMGNRKGDEGPERVFFTRHAALQTGQLEMNSLGLDVLFWLAVGCMPAGAQKVFCLDDMEALRRVPEAVTPDKEVFLPPKSPTPSRPSGRGVRFQDPYITASPPSDDYNNDFHGRLGVPFSPVVYVVPSQNPTQAVHDGRDFDSILLSHRTFRLSKYNERVIALSSLADAVGADNAHTLVYSLEEFEPAIDVVDRLVQDSSGTFLSYTSAWTQLGPEGHSNHGDWYLQRADAQVLAQALLHLPLSKHGYLVAQREPECKSMLSNAADSLPQLLTRLAWGLPSFGLSTDTVDALAASMTTMYNVTNPLRQTRQYFEAVFELDEQLSKAIAGDRVEMEVIGILMITSADFRSLISQAARHIEEFTDGFVELEIGAGTLNLASVMSFTYKFPVDLDILFNRHGLGDGTRRIPYPEVMLMCQKAALRSAVLSTSLDSEPLFSAVSKMDDIIYMG